MGCPNYLTGLVENKPAANIKHTFVNRISLESEISVNVLAPAGLLSSILLKAPILKSVAGLYHSI